MTQGESECPPVLLEAEELSPDGAAGVRPDLMTLPLRPPRRCADTSPDL